MRKRKRKKPIYVSNNEVQLTDWIPHYNSTFIEHDTNSWFDINYLLNPNQEETHEYTISAPIIPKESYQQQLKSMRLHKIKKDPVFLKCIKVRLYPNQQQKIILNEWFMAFTKMYNVTVDYIRGVIFYKHNLSFDVAGNFLNLSTIRGLLKDDRKKIIESMKYPTYAHILDEAINQAISNYKSAITNFGKGHIRKFRIRTWAYNRRRYILKIEKGFFKNGLLCPNVFGEIKSSEKKLDINNTCTLQFDRDTKKYILLVPKSIASKNYKTIDLDAGIDLGVRSFATVYSKNKVESIGNDLYKQISVYHKKIDKINELLSMTPEKRTNNAICEKIKRDTLKKALRKYHRKIINMVKDMHYKVAYHLVTAYDNIHIGKLSTKGILSKNNKKISPKTKRMVGVLSPYLFRQRLKYMGNKYGANVEEEDEYLTTKTCSNCGNIKELEGRKKYICECGMKSDRDVNAAKNILKVGYSREDKSYRKSRVKVYSLEGKEIMIVEGKKIEIVEV